jgi:hypothetical protein
VNQSTLTGYAGGTFPQVASDADLGITVHQANRALFFSGRRAFCLTPRIGLLSCAAMRTGPFNNSGAAFKNNSPSALYRLLVMPLAAGVLLLCTGVQAITITTPNGQTAAEGNNNNSYPFNLGPFAAFVPSGTQRYQQIYSASEFGALASGGEFITQIAFRPDAASTAFASTLPSIRIDLSTTIAAPDLLSTAFANSVGANDTIVYGGASGGALSLSSSFTGPAGGPKNFDIIINLTTPFFYNPAAGNLLLDVHNFGGGTTTPFDSQNTVGDSVSRVSTTSSGVGSATADLADSFGLVTRFTTVVPEPGRMALFGVALIGLFNFKRSSRQ